MGRMPAACGHTVAEADALVVWWCVLCHLLQAASLSGNSSPVGSRQLPPATVEQLEAFFDLQLAQVSGGWPAPAGGSTQQCC